MKNCFSGLGMVRIPKGEKRLKYIGNGLDSTTQVINGLNGLERVRIPKGDKGYQ